MILDAATTVDLLGALAYGELCAFDRLAEDARMAPTLQGRAAMAEMASREQAHYAKLAARIGELGADTHQAMAPFVPAVETYHSLTQPSTWHEGLVKAFVGDSLAADFFRELASLVDEPTRDLILEVVADYGRSEFAVAELKAAIAEQPALGGRLALWGRRLVGEAISQTQHVLVDRPSLMALLVGEDGDISKVTAMLGRITERHVERMTVLGLQG